MGLIQKMIRRAARDGDTPEERAAKETLVPFAFTVFSVVLVLYLIGGISKAFEAYGVGILLGLLGTGVSWLYVMITRRCPLIVPEAACITCACGIVIVDWHSRAAMGYAVWPIVVLVMDILLAVGARVSVQLGIIVSVIAYLCASETEASLRLGMWDIENWVDTDEFYMSTDCADPPCKTSLYASYATLVEYLIVLCGDYAATRAFAEGQRKERANILASIRVAEQVAHLLSAYSISDAQQVVDKDGEKLPPGLRSALELLLQNLTRYRPFLPESILREDDSGPDGRHSPDAGADDGNPPTDRQLDRAQVLPQLEASEMRGALRCIVSAAPEAVRGELELLMAETAQMCADSRDTRSVRLLLDCGWAPPPELRERLPVVSPEPKPTPTAALSLRRGTTVTESSAPQEQKESRYTDGMGDPAFAVSVVEFFPYGYAAPRVLDAVTALAAWHDPKGSTHWLRAQVGQLIADHATCFPEASPDGPLALYTYSVEIIEPVVWAAWQGTRWGCFANQDVRAAQTDFVRFQVDPAELVSRGMDPGALGSGEMHLLFEAPCGLRVYGAGCGPRLLRYENRQGGDAERSPLHDAVLWAPQPDSLLSSDSFLSLARTDETPPLPGVLEFITSRSAQERIARRTWESLPLLLAKVAQLREKCMAQKNQQRPEPRLCQLANKVFLVAPQDLRQPGVDGVQLALAVRAAYEAKCPGETPPPVQIAHACDLGLLRWHGRLILHALTGAPRCMVNIPTHGCPCAEEVWCVYSASDEQPYRLMNAAMRKQQSGLPHAELLCGPLSANLLTARQPRDAPPEPAAAQFCDLAADEGGSRAVTWTGAGFSWIDDPGRAALDDAQMTVNAWALPQYRALIWHIDAALRALPAAPGGAGQRRKGYRGLANVTLSGSLYARGRIVVFASFTSTSDDQGVASDFADGEGDAAIFTMYCCSGRLISMWSRYGREHEVLLPPNTVHLVKDALSAEHAAILNKSNIQIFDLKELTLAEAVAHLAKEGALKLCREHPGALSHAARARARAELGDWLGAARALLSRLHFSVHERRFQRPVLPKDGVGVIALQLWSPDGQQVGPDVDPELWSAFFAHAERKVHAYAGHVLATHLGRLIVRVSIPGDVEATKRLAIVLASELAQAKDLDVAQCRSPSATSPSLLSPATLAISSPLSPPDSAAMKLARASLLPAARRLSRGTAAAPLTVHCGVSVGKVHYGFGGSAEQRVEIVDGPAVRRAHAMAAYSLRFGLAEVVTDAQCAKLVEEVGLTTWTTDLVTFDAHKDVREPITCVAPQRGPVSSLSAGRIEDAWEAVLALAEDEGEAAEEHVRDCVAALPPGTLRAKAALLEAVLRPAAYCYDASGFF